MSIDEVLELAGWLVLIVAAGLGVAAVVPPAFTWAAGLAVVGVGLWLLSIVAERASRPKREGGSS